MHYKKPMLFIQSAITLSLMALSGYLAFKQPDWILAYASPTFIFGGLLILLCLLPFGGQVLGERQNRLPFHQYIGLLLAGQGALFVFSITAYLSFVGTGPKFTQGSIILPEAYTVIKEYYFTQWGFFPWGLFGLWGLAIAYTTYVKKGYPLASCIGYTLFKNVFESSAKAFNESMVFVATQLCLVFSLVAAIILLSHVIQWQLGLVSHLFIPFITVMSLSCVYLVGVFLLRKKNLIKWSKHLQLGKIVWMIVGVSIPILVFSAFLGACFLKRLPVEASQMQCDCAKYFSHVSMQTRIASLFWGWWLLWVPLAGSFIARVSQGRSVRELVIGVLCVPILLMGLLFLFPDGYPFWQVNQSILFRSILFSLFGFSTVGLLTWMLWGMKNNAFFYSGFMPLIDSPSQPLKTSRTHLWLAPKLSGVSKVIFLMVMGVISILLLHTIGGWFVIVFQLVSVGVFIMSMIYLGTICFLVQVVRDIPYKSPI